MMLITIINSIRVKPRFLRRCDMNVTYILDTAQA
jgi:hypothetical protein